VFLSQKLMSGEMETFEHHLHYVADTAEEALEEGIKYVIKHAAQWLPFLHASSKLENRHFNVTIKRLTVATSNKTFKCTFEKVESPNTRLENIVSFDFMQFIESDGINSSSHEDKQDSVIIRVYGKGSNVLTDRQNELKMLKIYSDLGLGSKLYATFDNGYITEYIQGSVLSVDNMRKPHISAKIANKLAQIHRVKLPENQAIIGIWKTIRKWLNVAQGLYSDNEFAQVAKDIDELEVVLKAYSSNVALTHNDLNHGNIIYNSKTDTVIFVDLEASDYSDIGFDIGNHFCEWAGLDLRFSEYPTKRDQMFFLKHYLAAFDSVNVEQVEEQKLEELYAQVNKYALLSHLFWYIWSKIQAKISDIKFDYKAYGNKRLEEFHKRKDHFLSLKTGK